MKENLFLSFRNGDEKAAALDRGLSPVILYTLQKRQIK